MKALNIRCKCGKKFDNQHLLGVLKQACFLAQILCPTLENIQGREGVIAATWQVLQLRRCTRRMASWYSFQKAMSIFSTPSQDHDQEWHTCEAVWFSGKVQWYSPGIKTWGRQPDARVWKIYYFKVTPKDDGQVRHNNHYNNHNFNDKNAYQGWREVWRQTWQGLQGALLGVQVHLANLWGSWDCQAHKSSSTHRVS